VVLLTNLMTVWVWEDGSHGVLTYRAFLQRGADDHLSAGTRVANPALRQGHSQRVRWNIPRQDRAEYEARKSRGGRAAGTAFPTKSAALVAWTAPAFPWPSSKLGRAPLVTLTFQSASLRGARAVQFWRQSFN